MGWDQSAIHAKVKDSAFSVVVETAQEALAKLAELSESEHTESK
jgi:hypothetical protein